LIPLLHFQRLTRARNAFDAQADIIYHLFDAFQAYLKKMKEEEQEAAKEKAVFPCVLQILPEHIFNNKDPIIVGVEVLEGVARVGTLVRTYVAPSTTARSLSAPAVFSLAIRRFAALCAFQGKDHYRQNRRVGKGTSVDQRLPLPISACRRISLASIRSSRAFYKSTGERQTPSKGCDGG